MILDYENGNESLVVTSTPLESQESSNGDTENPDQSKCGLHVMTSTLHVHDAGDFRESANRGQQRTPRDIQLM